VDQSEREEKGAGEGGGADEGEGAGGREGESEEERGSEYWQQVRDECAEEDQSADDMYEPRVNAPDGPDDCQDDNAELREVVVRRAAILQAQANYTVPHPYQVEAGMEILWLPPAAERGNSFLGRRSFVLSVVEHGPDDPDGHIVVDDLPVARKLQGWDRIIPCTAPGSNRRYQDVSQCQLVTSVASPHRPLRAAAFAESVTQARRRNDAQILETQEHGVVKEGRRRSTRSSAVRAAASLRDAAEAHSFASSDDEEEDKAYDDESEEQDEEGCQSMDEGEDDDDLDDANCGQTSSSSGDRSGSTAGSFELLFAEVPSLLSEADQKSHHDFISACRTEEHEGEAEYNYF